MKVTNSNIDSTTQLMSPDGGRAKPDFPVLGSHEYDNSIPFPSKRLKHDPVYTNNHPKAEGIPMTSNTVVRSAPTPAGRAAPTPADREVVKVTVNLPVDEVEAMKALAAERSTTSTSILRQALALEQYFSEALKEGATILVRSRNGDLKEVILR